MQPDAEGVERREGAVGGRLLRACGRGGRAPGRGLGRGRRGGCGRRSGRSCGCRGVGLARGELQHEIVLEGGTDALEETKRKLLIVRMERGRIVLFTAN